MRSLIKKNRLVIRLTAVDAVDLGRAARLESKRRGEVVGESTLLRELAMPKVRELLASASQEAA